MDSNIQELFEFCCKYGRLESAKIYIRDTVLDINRNNNYCFYIACANNHIDIAEWLLTLPNNKIIDTEGFKYALHYTSRYGTLNSLKWIIFKFGSYIMTYKFAFCYACESGNLINAQYLYNEFNLSPNFDSYNALWTAISNGHINIASWLYEIIDRNVPRLNSILSCAFRTAASHGHLESLKWLLSLEELSININFDNDSAFRFACEDGHIEVAHFLLSHPGNNIDIRANHDYAFVYACRNKHMEIVRYLCVLNDKYAYREYYGNILPFLKPNIDIINGTVPDGDCPICFHPVNVVTNCGHIFCHSCIERHTKNDIRCPICRTPINTCKKLTFFILL